MCDISWTVTFDRKERNSQKHETLLYINVWCLFDKVSYFVTIPACTKTSPSEQPRPCKVSPYSLSACKTRALNSWKAKHSAMPFSQNLAVFRICRCDCWCTSVVFTGGRISMLTSICNHTLSAHHSEFIVTSMYSNYSLYHLWLIAILVIGAFFFSFYADFLFGEILCWLRFGWSSFIYILSLSLTHTSLFFCTFLFNSPTDRNSMLMGLWRVLILILHIIYSVFIC